LICEAGLELMDPEPESEVLTYRAYRERQTLRAWERRRSAYEDSGSVVHFAGGARGALNWLRDKMERLSGEIARSV
jgi:hypothetical protein